MDFKVDKNAFKKALVITQKALPAVVVQEERSHVLVRTKGDKILVSSTNNDFKAQVEVPIEGTVKTDFSFTVEPKTILKLLTKTKIDTIKIEVDQEAFIARYYTSEDGSSFAEAQSFTEDVMLTFDNMLDGITNEITMNKSALVGGIKYASGFLEELKVEKARYDFIVINEGLIYAANGSNKMGFLVSRDFKNFKDYKMRKVFVPQLLKVIDALKNDEETSVTLFETDKSTGFRTSDNAVQFSCLKSDTPVPEVPRSMASTNGAHCIVNRKMFLEILDRISALDKTAKSFGIKTTLRGKGDNATIEMMLISSLKSKEVMPCKRVEKEDAPCGDIEHVIDNRLLKGIVSSFNNDDIRMYINDEGKMFKVYEQGEDEGNPYHAFAVGAYSKVLRK